ncbi:MAG: glycosyltransferase family 4 protein [Halobacteriota archaeon]
MTIASGDFSHDDATECSAPETTRVKKKLLFVGPCKQFFRSFMQSDLDILRAEFDVRLVHVCFNIHYLRETLTTPYRLIAGVAWADIIYCWFASREAFWAVLLAQLYGKNTAVLVGGADVTTVPELRYGAELKRTKRFYSRFVLHNASSILPYSKDAERGARRSLDDTSRLERIYLGVDVHKYRPLEVKRPVALTVGAVNQSNLKRKGLETFVRAAAYLPSIEFVLVGTFADDAINYLRSLASHNVTFTGFVSEQELVRCFQAAKVYVQVSAHEAFGVALAEAMACECVPVVTDRGAIPEVAGDAAIYVPFDDPKATAAGVQQAMRSEAGRAARERIEKCFALNKRKEALLSHINRLLS